MNANKTVPLILILLLGAASCALVQAEGLSGWAVGGPRDGYATILHTTNGGAAWDRQGSADDIENIQLGCVAAVDSNTAWTVGSSARGYSTIYHTTNAGATWSRQGNPDTVGNFDLSKISACSRDVAWVSGDAGAVLRTTDGGQTWQNRSPEGYSNYFQGITALDADNAWAAGHIQDGYAPILRTTNGGLSWARQSGGAATNIANILSIGAGDALHLWAAGFHGTYEGMVIGTTNGGETWETLYNATYHANELYVVNTAQVYVALDSFVIKTMDGGRSWEEIGNRSTAYATMGICAPDGRNAWAVSENWAGGFIYHIPAGGADWIDQTPAGGVASLSYVSFARIPGPSSLGTLNIGTSPSNGAWTVHAPPAGYAGPLCGTGLFSVAGAQVGGYRVSFSDLPGFRTPSAQTAWVTPGHASGITGLYLSRQPGDYDGDGKTDLALYDGQSGDWAVRLSGHGYQCLTINFGGPGWTPVAGDFDGDGKADPCVVQTPSGTWAALLSGGGYSFAQTACGIVDFQPVRGDFDGDGKSDLAAYRAADGLWSIWFSASDYGRAAFIFGGPGWTQQAGDFDGDGLADPCIYNDASGMWQAMLSSQDHVVCTIALGNAGRPAPADYDGDRKTDPAIYNSADGSWTVFCSGNNYAPETRFCGWPGFLPITGDYDGDDLADFTVYSPVAGIGIALLSNRCYTSADLLMGSGAFFPIW